MILDKAILIVGTALELTVLAMLFRIKAWRTLPLFCAYIGWSLMTDLPMSVVATKFPSYYNSFYFYEVVPDSLLQFGVLIELAWSVLRPSKSILPKGTIYILSGLLALTGALIWPLAAMTVPPNLSRQFELFIHFQQTVAILRIVCFLMMAGMSQILSIGWKDRELQIATGLGFFSLISLLVLVLHSHQLVDAPTYAWLDRAVAGSYFCTLSYWVFSFATKEQERKEFSPQMQNFLVYMGGGARAGRIALGDLPSERPRKRIK